MILTGDQKTDFFTVMALIDSFAEASGGKIKAKEDSLFALTKRIHIDFPCVDGLENANIFKKASVFLCEFIGEQIIENIESDSFCDKITKIPSYESAIVGFHVVTTLLNGATVGDSTIENPIELSQHSYIDIINALSSASINTSFRLIAVFLEQLVYKTNPKLQYSETTPIN